MTPPRVASNAQPNMSLDCLGYSDVISSVGEADFGTERQDLLKAILKPSLRPRHTRVGD